MSRFLPAAAAAWLLVAPQVASVRPTPPGDDLALALRAHAEARAGGFALEDASAGVTEALEELGGEGGVEAALAATSEWVAALRAGRDLDSFRTERGRVRSRTFVVGSFPRGIEVTYRLPEEYDPDAAEVPLVLAVPDADESPAEHLRRRWSAAGFREQAIVVSTEMPAEEEAWARVNLDGRPGGVTHLLAALRFADTTFAVDPDRVFVAGFGAGAATALAAGNYSPHRFAGVLARSGEVGGTKADNFVNLPTWLADCGESGETFRAAAAKLDADVTLLTGGDDVQAWRWVSARSRTACPERIRLVTGTPFPTRIGWLRVAPSAPGGWADARLDRATGEIRVQSEGVSHVTLALSDAWLGLDRELRVITNGVEHRFTPERSVRETLAMLYDGTSDRGCVYTARRTFDVARSDTGGERESDAADAPFEERLAEAGSDPDALWQVHVWCVASGREHGSRLALRRLVRFERDHADARAALGQYGAEGQWFATERAWERFRRSQTKEAAEERGHQRVKSFWVHRDQRSFPNKGWRLDAPTGQWLSRGEQRRLDEGWGRQDLTWVEPEEAGHVDAGRWLVDGEWVPLEAADRRRAAIDSMWTIPSREVRLSTTVSRDTARTAVEHMGRAVEDLQRVFGAEPPLPLRVVLLRDEEQYDRFAIGDPDGRRPAAHSGRLHVVHTGFLAERWFERVEGERTFLGAGVSYWDANAPHGDLYGVHNARLAAGISFVDALDPSPGAVRAALRHGPGADYSEAYGSEKRLPNWLRWGGAVYAERYFRDDGVGPDGDAWWARRWSLENLAREGGLRSLAAVLAGGLDPERPADGRRWLLEAGAVVAFVVDGECAAVAESHAEFRRRFAAGRLDEKVIEDLEESLRSHESELAAFLEGG